MKIHENELNTLFLFREVKVSVQVVEMWAGWCSGKRGRRRVLWFKALHFRTKFQFQYHFNWLTQRWSLKEFRTECIEAHCVSLSNQLYCIVAGYLLWNRRWTQRYWDVDGQGEGRCRAGVELEIYLLFIREMTLAVYLRHSTGLMFTHLL